MFYVVNVVKWTYSSGLIAMQLFQDPALPYSSVAPISINSVFCSQTSDLVPREFMGQGENSKSYR